MNIKTLSNIVSFVCCGIVVLVMNSMGYTILAWQTWLFLIVLFIMHSSGAIWMGKHIINKIEEESNKQDEFLRKELK